MDTNKCPTCKGKRRLLNVIDGEVMHERDYIPCPDCGGSGKAAQVEIKAENFITWPLKYDEHGAGYIFDAENHMIAQIRGTGRFSYAHNPDGSLKLDKKGRKMPSAEGWKIQDAIGRFLVDAANRQYESSPLPEEK